MAKGKWLRKLAVYLQDDPEHSYCGSAGAVFAALPQLETERLILRMARMRDAEDIFAYARDEQVTKYVFWDAHRSLADTREHLRFLRRQYLDGSPSSYVIVLKETGTVIGTIGFMEWNDRDSTVEVGYSIGRAWWGKGYTTEALRAVISMAFDTLRVNRVEAKHVVENAASGRVMEKCGMTCEGIRRGAVCLRGKYCDIAEWAILRKDMP